MNLFKKSTYRGPMYRSCGSKCGTFTWGYAPVACAKCVGKGNPLGKKRCYCEPIICDRANYDHMWSKYMGSKEKPVKIHTLPPGPRGLSTECEHDRCSVFKCNGKPPPDGGCLVEQQLRRQGANVR